MDGDSYKHGHADSLDEYGAFIVRKDDSWVARYIMRQMKMAMFVFNENGYSPWNSNEFQFHKRSDIGVDYKGDLSNSVHAVSYLIQDQTLRDIGYAP